MYSYTKHGSLNGASLTRPAILLLLASALVAPLTAQQSADDLAKALSNPVAALISVPIQVNYDTGYRNDGWKSVTNIQPVVPISISEDWNIISRTIVPVVFQEDVTGPGQKQDGLGDILATAFFSPKAPTASGLIWGVGPALSIPTGADGLTSDRWLLGPSAVFLKQTGAWTYGALINQVWDVGGSGNADISSLFLQPFCAWGGLGQGRTIAVNFESSYDWKGEQWTIPLNVMYSKVSKIGTQLVSYQGGVRAYLDRPNGGPDWGLRFTFTLLFPKH